MVSKGEGNDGSVVIEEELREAPRQQSAVVPPTERRNRRTVPVRTGTSHTVSIPKIAEDCSPTEHSSKEPKRNASNRLDPFGMNDEVERAVLNLLNDEEIRQTLDTDPKTSVLREKWLQTCKDIMRPPPLELPPFREINHSIPLIDPKLQHKYRLPKCPDAMKPQLLEKIERYTAAGWWQRVNTSQAAPLLCIAKKSGKLRTVVDARQRNNNTRKDVTPFPDQDQIRMDVARARYRSKIDLSDAYEQIRIAVEDVWKTAFSTPYGTFISLVMQQGDCNAPATFQSLMTAIFRDCIGRFVHVYLDDIFIFSDTVEEHERHLATVFDRLRKAKLFLSQTKCDLYSKAMDCLGHLIDDRGLHADRDKMKRIRNWRVPRSYNEVQRFLGLVNYLAHFLPEVTGYTAPLADMCRNNRPFVWRPLQDKCFESIKALASRAPILKPIDPKLDEPIWVISDASINGVGAVYGQGPEWQTCRPAGFLSRKFTSAQRAYHTYEREALAIMEALLKWEDKLLGRKIHIITDHKALTFFKGVPNLSN